MPKKSVLRPVTVRSGWSTTVRPWKAVRKLSRSVQWHRSSVSAWKPFGSGATDTVRPQHSPILGSPSRRRIAGFGVNSPSHAERTKSQSGLSVFRRGTRPPHDEMIAFIDKYRDQFGGRGHLPGTPDDRLWVSHPARVRRVQYGRNKLSARRLARLD